MFYLSEADLLLIDNYFIGMDKESPSRFQRILWDNGMDINKPVELQENTHRTLQRTIYTGRRFVGEERTDKAWLRGGAASSDAHINSAEDPELRLELRAMSREGLPYEGYTAMVERATNRGASE